ncbi:histidinol dehydrogenase [Desulfohalobium retbaense]|uniref:Histidinol dehydrogenase n=1 Tax=Desulfohalobium retbaense (strain ATCC 49708 / DSM 5692 / JCM 16813 / HR100) TaxID=485915 RepID=C8X2L1_DESRD|nr:histidinol dehydrogenase [Desulfohalobium retbaense]ACV68658.1 histidinol dehydrogenase [Desulfohalobium retbaense DSM 5692]
MTCRSLTYSSAQDWAAIRAWLAPRTEPDTSVEGPVREILQEVQQHGDATLVKYTQRFDCPDFQAHMLAVPQEQIEAAVQEIPAEDKRIIEEAAANIRDYHAKQQENSWFTPQSGGTILGQIVRPVDRAGLYVPGGQGGDTPLLSSLLMNAIPAQVAGVGDISLVTPPRVDGTVNPYILCTAGILGLDRVFAVGSAWAVAALAFGTETLPCVDVIAGPGNIFVATAKRLLQGQIGIDMVAGPSEIAIVADASASAERLAADMLSQAEHDPLASSILITDSQDLLQTTQQELERQLAELPRNTIARQSLSDWGACIRVPDTATGLELANRLAPEHLELCLESPWQWIDQVHHAGAVFLGHSTPEPVGDYFAGPNHVLPTIGTARFSSALSVQNFTKKTSLIATSDAYIQEHGAKIARMARLEGLEAHARSVETRYRCL